MKKLSLDSIKKWHAEAKDRCIVCAQIAAFLSIPYIIIGLTVVQVSSVY
jgi:hypothetical protein